MNIVGQQPKREESVRLSSLLDACKRNGKSELIARSPQGSRVSVRFSELAEQIDKLSELLIASELRQGDVIGIKAENSLDWIVWDLAAIQCGVVTHVFPVDWPESEAVVSKYHLAFLVADKREGDTPYLQNIASRDQRIKLNPEAERVDNADLHSRVYSSGTAGHMKGLDISKSGTEYVINAFLQQFRVTSTDSHIIFLPLSNYQQRLSIYGCIAAGADVIFSPYQEIFRVIKEEKPTFLIAPPIFYSTAIQLFGKNEERGSLTAGFGGRTRFLITGMAPILPKIIQRYWQDNLKLLDAYGMMECGMIAWNTEGEMKLCTVGKPLRTEDLAFSADGEIIVRRRFPLSLRYFEGGDERTFLGTGGISTGDYGELDDEGYLRLIGRKKEVIVAPNGKKFHPTEIEQRLREIPKVTDAVVMPHARTQHIVAIVRVENPSDSATAESVRACVARLNNAAESHLKVRQLVFTEVPLSNNQRFLTRNMKLNRGLVYEHFRSQIDS